METSDRLLLRMRDIDRLKVIQNVLDGRLKGRQAADQLQLSRRQVLRWVKRVRSQGNRGILHRLRGRPSNHHLNPSLIQRALEHLQKPKYQGFGPTFANEKLQALGIRLSDSSLRRVMIHARLWKARERQVTHRQWRPRRDCLGMLVQLDGSDHDWFEGRGPRCVLLLYIDDATSRILYAEFVDVEDTLTLLKCTQSYLQRLGRPLAFYVDKDSIYRVNRQATVEEDLQDQGPISQFTRAMTELGIQVIAANSPQAKGRVERSFATHQDRLVKELRLAKIASQQQANRFLWTTYIPQHNQRFAQAPANTTNAHRPLLPTHRLPEILSLRTERTLAHDFTLRYQKRFFQILPHQRLKVRPKDKLLVEVRLDDSVHLRFKERYVQFKSIPKPLYRPLSPLPNQTATVHARARPFKPSASSRQFHYGRKPSFFLENVPSL